MEGGIKRVEDLDVYRRLFNLHIKVHNLTLTFPGFELYELGSQLRRSSNSCPANLAEGFSNKHIKMYLEGISRIQAELRETKHHLKVAYCKKYITLEKLKYFIDEYDICGKMLTNLEKSLYKYT
ncbi:MAG: four helix bundle protein [Patescibacteria group bacterium]|nr:four helix bundle protein [Patescibacteria group bacterium]